MKSLRDISDAAAKIAEALDGFDEADITKAMAAARALKGFGNHAPQLVPAPYIAPWYPPSQPEWPQPWQVIGGTATYAIGNTCGGSIAPLNTACAVPGVTYTISLGGEFGAESH